MVLNKLKQIRNELKNSADVYDAAFKNTALIAASELVKNTVNLNEDREDSPSLNKVLDREYFTAKYGSLKNAKTAYLKIYGKQKYGNSWASFIAVANKLASSSQPKTLTLEQRITRIENLLRSLGHNL